MCHCNDSDANFCLPQQEKFRKNLKGKLEMAKFLQDTIEEMALENKGKDDPTKKVTEFKEFLTRVSEISNMLILNRKTD